MAKLADFVVALQGLDNCSKFLKPIFVVGYSSAQFQRQVFQGIFLLGSYRSSCTDQDNLQEVGLLEVLTIQLW